MYTIFDKHSFEYPAAPSCDVRALLGMKLLSFRTISKEWQFSSMILFNSMKKQLKKYIKFRNHNFQTNFELFKASTIENYLCWGCIFALHFSFCSEKKLCFRYRKKSFFFKKSQHFLHEYNVEFANLAKIKPIL